MIHQKNFLWQKIVVVILSLLFLHVVLEVGLRIAGQIIIMRQNNHNKLSFKDDQSYRILCVGESTTMLGDEYSYPSQLETILNSQGFSKGHR